MEEMLTIDGTCPGVTWRQNYEQWIEGGVTACALSIGGTNSARDGLSAIASAYRLIREDPRLALALNGDDIRRAHRDGKLAVYLQFQGTQELEYEPDLVEIFWNLGVRVTGLAYNRRGIVCDGCEEPEDAGVSRLGRRVIAEMNRVGMIVDISHTGWRSSAEAIELSSRPVVATHSNAHSVHQHPRNIPDSLIAAIIDSGGIVGLNGFPAFVSNEVAPTADHLIDHLVHIDSIAGRPGFAGLGIDYCEMDATTYSAMIASGTWTPEAYPPPPWNYPAEIGTPATITAFAERMAQRGYDEAAIAGVLGTNWLRVFDGHWTDPLSQSAAPRTASPTTKP